MMVELANQEWRDSADNAMRHRRTVWIWQKNVWRSPPKTV